MTNQFAEIKQRYRVQEHQIMGLKRDEVAASKYSDAPGGGKKVFMAE